MSQPQYPMGEMVPGQQIGWQASNAAGPGQQGPMRQFKGEQVPSAPPMDFIGDLPGYEGTNFDGGAFIGSSVVLFLMHAYLFRNFGEISD